MPRGRPRKHTVEIEDIKLIIRKFIIENWKSIEHIEFDVSPGVNLLVGRNAAGKSNILEAIYFLYKSLIEAPKRVPYVSHIPEYWSGLDLIYMKDQTRTVRIGFGLDLYIKSTGTRCGKWMHSTLTYVSTFSYEIKRDTLIPIGHNFILNNDTIIDIFENLTKIVIKGELARKINNIKSIEKILIKNNYVKRSEKGEVSYTLSIEIEEFSRPVPPLLGVGYTRRLDSASKIALVELLPLLPVPEPVIVPVWAYKHCSSRNEGESVSQAGVPWIRFRGRPGFPTPVHAAASVLEIIERFLLLKHPDIGALSEPARFEGRDKLDPRAKNLPEVLMTLRGRRSELEILRVALERGFPGVTVRVESSYGGRVSLVAEEHGIDLPPPNMPDGLIKLVAIAVGLETRPSVFLLDEIENSMHAKLLEIVFDILNSRNIPVIVATHSPVVVDLAGPERVLVVRKVDGKTVVERIRDPRELGKKLASEGITLSDYILYTTADED